MSSNNMADPRRPNRVLRYKPPSTENNPTLEDPTPDYMNLLGMIFSMCGLMLKELWLYFDWVNLAMLIHCSITLWLGYYTVLYMGLPTRQLKKMS